MNCCRIKDCPYYNYLVNNACCHLLATRLLSHGHALCYKSETANDGVLIVNDEKGL